MDEAPEHPTTAADPAKAESGPVLGLPGGGGAEPYRPLSLLAVSGFALAVVYAASVTVGGLAIFAARYPTSSKLLVVLIPAAAILAAVLRREPGRMGVYVGLALALSATVLGLGSLVAFSGAQPWGLPGTMAMWVVLVGAIVISWMARVRIQSSEDTLSGAALARWGLGIGLFFGVNYSALYLASNLAVRSQARECADDFLQQIQKGDLVQAYVLTLQPSSRPAINRDTLEMTANVPSSTREPGTFSKFCQSDLVRLLQMGGAETRLELQSASPELDPAGVYKVALRYRATTPQGAFEAAVQAVSRESAGQARRQWYIDVQGTGVVERKKPTLQGEEMAASSQAAAMFADQWLQKLKFGHLDAAYLDTVAPRQRGPQLMAHVFSSPIMGSAAGLGPLATTLGTPAGKAYREGQQAFKDGALLDVKDFWASEKKVDGQTFGAVMRADVRKLFDGTASVPLDLAVENVRYPLVVTRNGRTLLGISCRIGIPSQKGGPEFRLEGEVLVDTPISANPQFGAMRIDSLRLVRGQSAAPSRRPRR